MNEEKTFKWTLRRGGKKLRCPNCGELRFVPYVLAADGRTLATDAGGNAVFGRCDRENNCGYHRYPSQDIATEAQFSEVQHVEEKPIIFSSNVLHTSCNDVLFSWASNLIGEARARILWNAYHVGSVNGKTIWWQVDIDGRVKAGKVMEYGTDGHRIKDEARPYACGWTHKMRQYNQWHTGERLEQCFFGEHLLRKNPDKPVAIVESEKTAVLMNAWSPNFIWLASGGSQGINDRKMKVLEGRTVRLLPDQGMTWNWWQWAKKYSHTIISIEDCSVFEGCDILDVCIENNDQLTQFSQSYENK